MRSWRLWPLAAIVLISTLAGVVQASEDPRPSCDDLVELANFLEEVADTVQQTGTLAHGDAMDRALGDLVDGLARISATEQCTPLAQAVAILTKAYASMDLVLLHISLDSVVANIDRLYQRDCYQDEGAPGDADMGLPVRPCAARPSRSAMPPAAPPGEGDGAPTALP